MAAPDLRWWSNGDFFNFLDSLREGREFRIVEILSTWPMRVLIVFPAVGKGTNMRSTAVTRDEVTQKSSVHGTDVLRDVQD